MRAFIALILSIFSFILIDLNLIKKRRVSSRTSVFISDEFENKKVENKKAKRRYKNRKYKKKTSHFNKIYKLKGTKSKDPRHSNQQKLRRMYRNS